MSKPNGTLTTRLLREHIARDAPARERTVAKFMAGVCTVSGVLALCLVPMIGVKLGLGLGVMLLLLAGYYFAIIRFIGQGWFHPAVTWVNVAIEVSAPSLIFLLDAKQNGVLYALTAPPLVIWGTLIALSGLRSNRALSLGAGALAAIEYSLLYAFVAYPNLPPEIPVTVRPALFATRVVLLFASAVFTAAFVGVLNRRAEEALSAVRAKDVFGKYLLHERLGMGGMAEVFRATYNPEGGFEKVVALKRVLPQFVEDEAFIGMFRDEAALCSQFSHPGVVQVFDFGRFGDSYFLAMEYLDGPPLSRVLRAFKGSGLPIGAVVHLAVSLTESLAYVHERRAPDGRPLNLVHRDLNPPNVLLSKLGEVKLTDFGIARAVGHMQLTEAGMIKGKPGYLAPEQAAGEDIDGRVDLFALGVTLWECLTGEQLLAAADATAMVRNTFDKPIVPPRQKRPQVPQALETFVMDLLERDLSKRMPSAREALRTARALETQFPQGQKDLMQVVDMTLKTTVSSAVSLPPAARGTQATPIGPDAPTMPGRG